MVCERIAGMRRAHEVVAELVYEPAAIERGYANRWLRVDLASNTIEVRPVTRQMKDLWVGGKGFDLWLLFKEISAGTRWNSPENAVCFSAGPLGGTTSFPGAGKTLVTAISPMTDIAIDCNVGGYFGPYLKFSGFDALAIVGKAREESIVCIDGDRRRVTIERAPRESVDSHLVAEELTEMYADDEEDRRNVAVVSAGRGAGHALMGVLNFSFYDWRRRAARLKQAGRGGVGTVLRDKRLKALVVKNRELARPWRVAESKVARAFALPAAAAAPGAAGIARVEAIVEKWRRDPEFVIEMLQDVQDAQRHVSQAAVDTISLRTGVPRGRLYHIATFYKAFSLRPRGEKVIQVCVGTTCHVKGAMRLLDAFERELGVARGGTTPDGRWSLEAVACLGCCSLAPVAKIGEEVHGNLKIKDVAGLVGKKRSKRHV